MIAHRCTPGTIEDRIERLVSPTILVSDKLVQSEYKGSARREHWGACPYCQFMDSKHQIRFTLWTHVLFQDTLNCQTPGIVYFYPNVGVFCRKDQTEGTPLVAVGCLPLLIYTRTHAFNMGVVRWRGAVTHPPFSGKAFCPHVYLDKVFFPMTMVWWLLGCWG